MRGVKEEFEKPVQEPDRANLLVGNEGSGRISVLCSASLSITAANEELSKEEASFHATRQTSWVEGQIQGRSFVPALQHNNGD